MKLPSSQPPPTVSSGEGAAPSNSTTSAPSAQMARDAQLQKLINTWVKVESIQVLSPKDSRQALQSMQDNIRISGQAVPTSVKPQVTSPQGQKQPTTPPKAIDPNELLKVPTKTINIATSAQPMPLPKLAPAQQLALLTLSTQQGTLTILSMQPHDKGSQLLVQQSATGQWQFQTPNKLMALTAISHQYNELKAVASALKLNAFGPSQQSPLQSQSATRSTSVSPPQSLLDATKDLNVKLIKQAIEQSGQFLEQKLLKSAAEPLSQSKPTLSIDLNQRLKQVESQIQKWIDALPVKLNKLSQSSSIPTNIIAAKSTNPVGTPAPQEGINFKNIQGATEGLKISSPITNTKEGGNVSPASSTVDNKAWLIKLQLQLFKDWQATSNNNSTAKDSLLNNRAPTNTYAHLQSTIAQKANGASSFQPTNAAKPLINWFEGMAQQHQSSSSIHDTKTSNLLEWLLTPKAPTSEKGLPIWPNNLSAQVQVHKLLQNLILQQPQITESQEGPEKILRQLLQVSQSLTRIQHEQVNNRLSMQQQPDNLNLNFSVPYMHQQNVNWCDLELSQQGSENDQKKQTLGWHLVLRFAQDTPDTFAIESYLNSDQLQLTLWAKEQEPLAKLHQHAGLLREKLNQAGFKVESIQSKQGLPAKNQQQVHQSMVDVHT